MRKHEGWYGFDIGGRTNYRINDLHINGFSKRGECRVL